MEEYESIPPCPVPNHQFGHGHEHQTVNSHQTCCDKGHCENDIPTKIAKPDSCCDANGCHDSLARAHDESGNRSYDHGHDTSENFGANDCCNNSDCCWNDQVEKVDCNSSCCSDGNCRCDTHPKSGGCCKTRHGQKVRDEKAVSKCCDSPDEIPEKDVCRAKCPKTTCSPRRNLKTKFSNCCDDENCGTVPMTVPGNTCPPRCTSKKNSDCCDDENCGTVPMRAIGNTCSPRGNSENTSLNTCSPKEIRPTEILHKQISAVGAYAILVKSEEEEAGGVNNECSACDACDPSSKIPHAIKVSRFRVANLCCAGEEKIIRNCLQDMHGVENVAVNVIGRYIVIKHCNVECCAPGSKIVDILNAKHLGASLQEAAGNDDGDKEGYDWLRIAHVAIVLAVFAFGVILQYMIMVHQASSITYLASTALGLPPILYSSYITILRKTVSIHILMTIAIAGAIAGSEYFDASLVVVLFILAELIESIAMMKVRQAINASSTSMVKEAYLSSGKKVKIEDLKVGDILAVRAGEMILGDGIVIKGEGVVDESALTGESVPVVKKRGAAVLSGTVVQNGFMEVELNVDYLNCTMTRLNQEVADVQADRGEYAMIMDRFSLYWTPGVIVGTLIFVLVGGGVTNDWMSYTHRGLVLLVLACPCAIVIAAPIPSVCAIAAAAKNGVLIRGSSVVERMSTINTIALDKTGTLTKGFFKVGRRMVLDSSSDADPMRLAAAIEQKSTHPLAHAVVSAYVGCVADMAESDMQMPNVRKIVVEDGVGVSGWVETEPDVWQHVAIGNERLLKANGGIVVVSPAHEALMVDFNKLSDGQVVLTVTIDNKVALLLSLSDELRTEATELVSSLTKLKMTVSMLTGDQEQVAIDVCKQVGIPLSECNFRLLPREKLEWIEFKQNVTVSTSRKKKNKVLMVGDGINDSIALTAADVGVAMGAGGSAMAVASADMILMTDNLLLIPSAVELCRLACTVVVQNFAFAIAVKIAAIVLALMGGMHFWQAVLVDMGTLLFVIGNGIRPLFYGGFVPKNQMKI